MFRWYNNESKDNNKNKNNYNNHNTTTTFNNNNNTLILKTIYISVIKDCLWIKNIFLKILFLKNGKTFRVSYL